MLRLPALREYEMNISTESLRELHRIHRQLKDLRDRLDRGPKQMAAADANIKKMESELEQAKDASKKTRGRAPETSPLRSTSCQRR